MASSTEKISQNYIKIYKAVGTHERFHSHVNNGELGYAGELRFDYAMGFIRCVEKIHLCGSVFCQFNTGIPT